MERIDRALCVVSLPSQSLFKGENSQSTGKQPRLSIGFFIPHWPYLPLPPPKKKICHLLGRTWGRRQRKLGNYGLHTWFEKMTIILFRKTQEGREKPPPQLLSGPTPYDTKGDQECLVNFEHSVCDSGVAHSFLSLLYHATKV